MASTNSNKGRAVVLSAACVTMFFISSIALYSVVSKNLLAVYPEWSSALTWAFPVFQTIMAVTGIFAGRISDKIGPRNVVIAAAVCYGLGWFMSGTVTEPWQFYLWFSLVAAIGNGLGYNPALTTGQKWFIDKKGLASGITLAASTAGPAVLSPVLASLLIPSLGIFGALKTLGVIFFVTIAASALFLKAPETGWLPEGFEAPKGGAHAGTFGDLTPGEMVKTPRFWVLIVTSSGRTHRRLPSPQRRRTVSRSARNLLTASSPRAWAFMRASRTSPYTTDATSRSLLSFKGIS